LIRERWLTARVDDCVTPAGVSADYYVPEYPGWTNLVALDGDASTVMRLGMFLLSCRAASLSRRKPD